MEIQRILWPTDFSTLSRSALPFVNEMALRFSAAVDAVHAIPTLPTIAAAGSPDAPAVSLTSYLSSMREQAEERLQKLVTDAVVDSIDTHWEVLNGNPAYAIVNYASDRHSDLIILSTHGETGVTRLVFGSVAEKVVRLAKCPVLVIPSEVTE
jgi:nucleotide-binding universal stress UspA family protein